MNFLKIVVSLLEAILVKMTVAMVKRRASKDAP